jgi:hypothetical protein
MSATSSHFPLKQNRNQFTEDRHHRAKNLCVSQYLAQWHGQSGCPEMFAKVVLQDDHMHYELERGAGNKW